VDGKKKKKKMDDEKLVKIFDSGLKL
jgi:hypothetical protein